MGLEAQSDFVANFPTITFRRKRLTVTIHAHFHLDGANDVAAARQAIENAIGELSKHGQTQHTYSVVEI